MTETVPQQAAVGGVGGIGAVAALAPAVQSAMREATYRRIAAFKGGPDSLPFAFALGTTALEITSKMPPSPPAPTSAPTLDTRICSTLRGCETKAQSMQQIDPSSPSQSSLQPPRIFSPNPARKNGAISKKSSEAIAAATTTGNTPAFDGKARHILHLASNSTSSSPAPDYLQSSAGRVTVGSSSKCTTSSSKVDDTVSLNEVPQQHASDDYHYQPHQHQQKQKQSDSISQDVREVILGLLQPDPLRRTSAEKLQSCSWLAEDAL